MPVRALDHSRIGVGKFLHRRWQIPFLLQFSNLENVADMS